jgi:hypothetical protein
MNALIRNAFLARLGRDDGCGPLDQGLISALRRAALFWVVRTCDLQAVHMRLAAGLQARCGAKKAGSGAFPGRASPWHADREIEFAEPLA